MSKPLYSVGGFALARAVASRLPRAACRRLAPPVARWASLRQPAGREAMRLNLSHVTGRPGQELHSLLRRNVDNFSRMLADYFYYSSHPPQAAEQLLERWEGYEHLQAARAAGRGTILVTGHVGNWELGGVILALRGLPVTIVTADEPSGALTTWRQRYREAVGIRTIAVGPGREFAFVEMLQVLRRNECLALLVDRPYEGSGVPINFFGAPAAFSTGPALLHAHSGAAVVPAFVTEGAQGGYVAQAFAPQPMSGQRRDPAALQADTQTLASAFESVIRHNLAQWYNYVPVWFSPSR